MVSPDGIGDIGMGQHLADMFGKQAKQLVFNRGQMQFLVVQIDTAGRIIDFQLPIDKYRRFVAAPCCATSRL